MIKKTEKPPINDGWSISKNGIIELKSQTWICKLIKFFSRLSNPPIS